MVWNTVWPDPAKSVKANTPTGQQNTTYIDDTMNVSHYWNEGANLDGQHQYFACPKQASDLAIPTSMDGVIYYKEVSASNSRVEGFYRNNSGIFQFIPSFQSGTVDLSSTDFVTVANLPDNSYGNIYLFLNDAVDATAGMQFGTFKSAGGKLQAYCSQGGNTTAVPIILGNATNSSALELKAKRSQAPSGTYAYRIMYWGI